MDTSRRPSFSDLPLFIIAAALSAGILCAHFAEVPLAAALASGVSASFASLAAFVGRRLLLASSLALVAFAGAGATLAITERESVADTRVRRFYEDGRIRSGEPVEVTGVVESAPEPAPDGLFISLGVERLRYRGDERAACGRIELFAPARADAAGREAYDALELRRGARLRLLVALSRSDGFRNPGVSPFSEYLDGRGLDAGGMIKSPLIVERLDDEPVFMPLTWLDSLRAWLIERAGRQFSKETAGVFGAAVLGNRHGLARSTAESFREGGTFHVLVISGLHVTFVGGLVWFIARRLTPRRVWQWSASALTVWLYSLVVGAEVSVVRAALMFTLVALARVVARRSGGVNALGGAALVLLVRRPVNLFDASFQLTFLSVLSIVALAWPLLFKLRQTGAWRPTQGTPYPPVCPRAWLIVGEALFWSERRWRREMARAGDGHSYELFKSPLAARLERWRLQRPLRYAFTAVVVSACVQLGMLPALVLYFHRVSLSALLLNIWVDILMVVLSFAALAAIALAPFAARAAATFAQLAETANWLMTHGVDPFVAAGAAGARVPEYTGAASLVYAFYFAALLFLAHALAGWQPVSLRHENFAAALARATRRRTVFAAAASVSLLLIIIFHPLSAARTRGRLRVDFLDVGQGDSALLTMPDGTTLLIDGGGRPRFNARAAAEGEAEGETFEPDERAIGERVVSEYLWWRGLSAVDYILATHADADHIDGLSDVAKNFHVRAALVARAPAGDTEFARFAKMAARAGVPVQLIGRGDRLQFGDAQVDVLWPPPAAEDAATQQSSNDDSIVLRVRFGGRAFLLTGDIEARAEAALVGERAERGASLRCDVLKVAHHGSRTSSTAPFVDATRPSFAVVSVGLDSPFGHPHREVLERWRVAGSQPLTTGECGTITISTDGNDLRVETYVADCKKE